MTIEDGEAQLGKVSDIELWIGDYDYIFSDFDSRPYSERLLSEDLLSEMNRVSKDKKSEEVEVQFLIPNDKRDPKREVVIKKRLKDQFRINLKNLKETKKKMLRQGLLFVLFGVVFMFIATFFLTRGDGNYLITFLSVISEPAGWFLFWEGLNLLIFDIKKKVPDLDFYEKMSKAKINFADTNPVKQTQNAL
jgi:hypothetical protein